MFMALLAHHCLTKFPIEYPQHTSGNENFEYCYCLIYFLNIKPLISTLTVQKIRSLSNADKKAFLCYCKNDNVWQKKNGCS